MADSHPKCNCVASTVTLRLPCEYCRLKSGNYEIRYLPLYAKLDMAVYW